MTNSDEKDSTAIQPPYTNIADVLRAAVAKRYKNRGRDSCIFELPEGAFEGSENYLIKFRIPDELSDAFGWNIISGDEDALKIKAAFDEALKTTSSLTPLSLTGIKKNFGQPYLRGGSIQIVKKIPGIAT